MREGRKGKDREIKLLAYSVMKFFHRYCLTIIVNMKGKGKAKKVKRWFSGK
jgi:hypothetical protein